MKRSKHNRAIVLLDADMDAIVKRIVKPQKGDTTQGLCEALVTLEKGRAVVENLAILRRDSDPVI